jgi:Mn2+/Fe2+ NRAMP family transporter
MVRKNQRYIISGFIIFSTCIFAFIGRPVKVLVMVGALNGLILPISLGLMLIAALRFKNRWQLQTPVWMSVIGWIVVMAMSWME